MLDYGYHFWIVLWLLLGIIGTSVWIWACEDVITVNKLLAWLLLSVLGPLMFAPLIFDLIGQIINLILAFLNGPLRQIKTGWNRVGKVVLWERRR